MGQGRGAGGGAGHVGDAVVHHVVIYVYIGVGYAGSGQTLYRNSTVCRDCYRRYG